MSYTETVTIISVGAQGDQVIVTLQRADGSVITITDAIANAGSYVLSTTHTMTIA